MKDPISPLRPLEIVWIARFRTRQMWPGFLTKIRTDQSKVKMHYRFILGKPRTYVGQLKMGRIRKFKESDALTDEQKKIPGLVAAYESAKNYLITLASLKGKGKVKLLTPMEYFFPNEGSRGSAKKPKVVISEDYPVLKIPKIEISDEELPGTSTDHFNKQWPTKETPNELQDGKLQNIELQNLKLQKSRTQEAIPETLKSEDANIVKIKPQEVKPHGARLHEKQLQEAKLQEKKLEDAKLQEKKLQDAKLQEKRFPEAMVHEKRLQEAKFQEKRLQETKLQEKRLQETKLQEKRLQAPRRQEARLLKTGPATRTRLREAKHPKASFQKKELLQMEKLQETLLRHAEELHVAKIRNEKQFYKESRDISEARVAALEFSSMLREEIFLIDKETALLKNQEAEINNKIGLAKLKMVEIELKNLEQGLTLQ